MKNFFKKLMSSKSQSKYFSETVQRVGKNNAGFSLVELIVVIAIMAILAAVAVIGVSVYIPKAQKAADEQMIADIQKAVDLYANLESVTPGQSGYIVIHRDGNGETNNVSIGGAMDKFLTDAVVATFGEKYGTELKVSYKEWTGALSGSDIQNIKDSQYFENPSNILETVDMLTGAMKLYYGDQANAQEKANMTVMDIAAATKNKVDKDKLIEWWTTETLVNMPQSDIFIEAEGKPTGNEATKIQMAAWYARGKAFVDFTGCSVCQETFGTADKNPFENATNASGALAALQEIINETVAHVSGCGTCMPKVDQYYATSARSDAEAYVAMLGQIDTMSDQIVGSEEFKDDGFYTSGFVTDLVNGYVTEINSYGATGAKDGDIVITVLIDRNGNIQFKTNLNN